MENKIDVIITSYKRWDLLRMTLNSFINQCKFNYKIHVYEDFGIKNMDNKELTEFQNLLVEYKQVNFIYGDERIGQVRALDILMQHVTSEYYIKLEDDWLCINGGFIEESFSIMDKFKDCVCVWLRGINPIDVNGHPIIEKDGLLTFSTDYHWKGFSWGASVHRLSDYKELGAYSKHTFFFPRKPFTAEKAIAEIYFKKGFFAATLREQYFIHIGGDRGIRK